MRCDPLERTEGLTAMMRLLIDRGAELTARSAVIVGDAEFLREAHARNDLVTPQDDRGWLLSLAVDCDRPGISKLLLDFGLDPDARVRVGDADEIAFTWGMPLYQCARYGKHAMAEMLLERGADPNGQVYASGTPLSEAYGQRDEPDDCPAGALSAASRTRPWRVCTGERSARAACSSNSAMPTCPTTAFRAVPWPQQLLGAAARGGDPEILRMAMDTCRLAARRPALERLLLAPLGFWNHWIGPWCHHEWDRTTYLTCFNMILERSGPPNHRHRSGATLLHEIVTMGDHTPPEERVAFATAGP